MGFAYDNGLSLPNNKTDTGSPKPSIPADFVAADANALANAATDLRSAVQAGDFHGTRDMTGGMPSVAASGNSIWTTRANKAVISQSGGPYLLVRNIDYVNVTDPQYGAVPDWNGTTGTDNTAAFNAAIAACVWTSGKRRVLYIPPGRYRCRSKVVIPASLGFTMVGEGRWASQIVFDPTTPNDDGLCVNSSQFVTLEGFSLFGIKANPAGKLLFFDYTPVVNAGTQLVMRDLWLTSNDADSGYAHGIFFSEAYGNNSETQYYSTVIERFATNGVTLPGSQQKAHNFYGCTINGSWDGVVGHAGGAYGVLAGGGSAGGSFSFRDGGVSGCKSGAFGIFYPNDPIAIEGVQSEHCYSFIDMGTVALGNSSLVTVRGCRIDVGGTAYDSDGVVKFAGDGPFIFQGNSINAGSANGIPKIRLSATADVAHIRIVENNFLTPNSVNTSPFVQGGSGGAVVDMHSNMFRSSGGVIFYRDEHLDINPNLVVGSIGMTSGVNFPTGIKMYYMGANAYTAAALTQSVVQVTLPKRTIIKGIYVVIDEVFAHPTAATITVSVGKTSGGTEYVNAANAKAAARTCYIASGTPDVPNYGGTQAIYVTVTVNADNVGTGTVTKFTAGDFRILMDVEVAQPTPATV